MLKNFTFQAYYVEILIFYEFRVPFLFNKVHNIEHMKYNQNSLIKDVIMCLICAKTTYISIVI